MPETWCARRCLRDPRIAICRRVGDRRPVALRRPSGARGFVRMAGWPGCRFAPAARPPAGRGARPCAGRPRRCAGGGESRSSGSVGAPRPAEGRNMAAARTPFGLNAPSRQPRKCPGSVGLPRAAPGEGRRPAIRPAPHSGRPWAGHLGSSCGSHDLRRLHGPAAGRRCKTDSR